MCSSCIRRMESNLSACVRTEETSAISRNTLQTAYSFPQLTPNFICIWHCISNRLCFLQGGVGLRIRVYDRRICFVSNHFAAHQENISRRNDDFNHIYRTMSFNKPHGSTGIFLSKFLLKVLWFITLVHMTFIMCFLYGYATASATSVQLHKAVSVLVLIKFCYRTN
jgi:hypothetical protein